MTLAQRLQDDLTRAIRERDDVRRDSLRMAIAAVYNAQKAQRRELADEEVVSVGSPPADGTVGPWSYPRRILSRAEKYERLAFTFCRMGTVGLIAWAIGPAWFVLIVAIAAVALYARAITLGVGWTKCFLRRPTWIVGFWLLVAIADAYWILVLGQRLPGV